MKLFLVILLKTNISEHTYTQTHFVNNDEFRFTDFSNIKSYFNRYPEVLVNKIRRYIVPSSITFEHRCEQNIK